MSASPYTYQRYLLGSLRTEFQLDELQTMALQPGIQSAYRITCHYPHNTPPNSVATVIQRIGQPPSLHIAYEGLPAAEILENLEPTLFQSFTSTLSKIKFDRLEDAPGIPPTGITLWLVERAAAGFHKALLLAPELAQPPYDTLIQTFEQYIPQAVQPLEVSNGGN